MKVYTVLPLFASHVKSHEEHEVKLFTKREDAVEFAIRSFMDFQNENQELFEQGWIYDRSRTEIKVWDEEVVRATFENVQPEVIMSFENDSYEVWTVQLQEHQLNK